uniref:InlB B-repeat-containing protein n=1 Tax=Mariniphaga sediminis TaxID=1628158 RepID=UPI003565C8D5
VILELSASNGGSVDGEGIYDEGTSVTVNAIADTDYEFLNWREYDSNEIVSTDADYTFVLNEDRSLIAYFEEFVKSFLITKEENTNLPIIANYIGNEELDNLVIKTRYIGDSFIEDGISIDNSGVTNINGVTQMVINTQDLENRNLYKHITGGGPHIWISKQPSLENRLNPWTDNDELVLQMNAAVPFVELKDKDGNTGTSGFSADKAPVTQLSFGLYLYDEGSQKTFAYIIPVYESRGTFKESANNNDTWTSFVSTPLEDDSRYITKAQNSARLQSEPFPDEKFFKVSLTRENLLKGIKDTNIGLSEDLSNYQLTIVGVLFELPNYVENGHNTSMVEIIDFTVYLK